MTSSVAWWFIMRIWFCILWKIKKKLRFEKWSTFYCFLSITGKNWIIIIWIFVYSVWFSQKWLHFSSLGHKSLFFLHWTKVKSSRKLPPNYLWFFLIFQQKCLGLFSIELLRYHSSSWLNRKDQIHCWNTLHRMYSCKQCHKHILVAKSIDAM